MKQIPEQRKMRIFDLVRERGSVSVKELACLLAASEATIRRDLDDLKRRGSIARSHGGAVLDRSLRTTFEPAYNYASKMAYAEKLAIGEYAASRLEEGQSVIFDSSSTVCEAARFAAEKGKKISAITNDVNTATILAQAPSIRVIVLGGTIRTGSYTTLGEPGSAFLEGLHVDVTILGIHAIHDGNLSDTSVEVAAMKRSMVRAGRRIMVLADSTKFGTPAFCDVCSLSEITEIITDWGISETHQADLRQRRVAFVKVEPLTSNPN
jgi:DeoR family transcriptional regulator of aga operon